MFSFRKTTRYGIETTVYHCQRQQLATSALGMVHVWARNHQNEDFSKK